MRKVLVLLCLFFLISQASFSKHAKYLSPMQFGLFEALNGVDRYYALEKCHDAAVSKGLPISYKGIDTIELEIPQNATPLSLPANTDFANVTIKVLNCHKDCFLFRRSFSNSTDIDLDGNSLLKGSCIGNVCLQNGMRLLIIEDKNQWIKNRKGYEYGFTRKDVLLVKNGYITSNPTFPYTSEQSQPVCKIIKVSKERKYFRNLNFVRDNLSTFKTYLVAIEGEYNFELSNITVSTPDIYSMYGDQLISVYDSYDIILQDITINGTYSREDKFGYGLSLNNIHNLNVNRLKTKSKWGVFGTNNINTVYLKNCDINRFDIHCYGRDVKAVDCTFRNLYNQFSSVYGFVSFESCRFISSVPVLIEASFNAYTPFDIDFHKCYFELPSDNCYLITFMKLNNDINQRPELKRKAIPNVSISNCTIIIPDQVQKWYIYDTGPVSYNEPLDHISLIDIYKLNMSEHSKMDIFSNVVETTNQIKVNIRKSILYTIDGNKQPYFNCNYTINSKANVLCR